MSTEQKVALAREAQGKHALSSALEALELSRSTWYYHQNHRVSYTAKYAHLREPLETIAREHPEYGYRRTTAELREAYGYRINHKVVQRL
ncbi:MAG: IS3 family transposase, partial [Anaerolineae bacterium]